MLRNLFNSQSKTITGAAIIIGAASLASRLLGLARDRVLAHYFGAGNVIDAYYAAFKIPDFVYTLLIIGALSAGFIPVFTKLYLERTKNKEQRTNAWLLVNNVLNVLGTGLIFVVLILIIFTPALIPLVAPGFSAEKITLTILLTRIMLFSPVLLGFSAVVSGVLQSLRNFLIYSLSPIMYNLGIILGAVVFVPLFGEPGLAWGVVLGAGLHLLVQLPSLWRAGFRFSFYLNLRDSSLRLIAKLMLPRLLGLASSQINLIVITALASTLAAGSVAIFNYANNLQSFPLGIIGVSFAVAAFPTLTALAAQNKKEEIVQNLSSTVRQILFFIIPLSIIFLMLRAQIVRVVLGTGQFDWTATVKTADTLAFFSLSLFAQSLIPLLARAFFALEDTKTPFFIGLISALINIGLSWWLTRPGMGFEVEGLALAFTISVILNFILLWIFLRFRLGSLAEEVILPSFYKMTVAAMLMGLAIQGLKTLVAPLVNMGTFLGIFSQGLAAGLGGLAIYVLAGLILKNREMIVFVETIKKRCVRRKDLPIDVSGMGTS